jgi:hypothetical protein
MHQELVIVRDARNFVRPDFLLLEWVMRDALSEKMLKESHVLKTKQGDLIMGLVGYLR